jgi:prolipoprotein diacylglyceryltransferase
MRPLLVEWLVRHGLPAWLAPDYAAMVGIAAGLSAVLVMRLVGRDGEDRAIQARALLLAYFAALVGGFAFEWIRALPLAIALGSPDPVVFAGRAAYGGLIASLLGAAVYLRAKKQSAVAFFDRAVVPMGIAFAFVRVGCFLEGCDYGRPTTLPWGVRFPPGSLAARAHTSLGWVPEGAFSLPVHPTEIYESLLGLVALALALPVLLRSRRRDGRAFAVWMTAYAAGRLALELLRADADRGIYGRLSSAQYVSVTILGALAVAVVRRRRLARALAAVLVAVVVMPRAALAEPAAAPAQPAATTQQPSAGSTDALTLRDGSRVTGRIVEVAPGDHATVQMPDGSTQTYPWVSVQRIEMAGVAMTYGAPPPPPAPSSPPAPASASVPAAADNGAASGTRRDRWLTVRGTLVTSLVLARPDVPSGLATEIDALYRLRLGDTTRLDLGIEGRLLQNAEASEWSLGVPLELVLEVGRKLELIADLVVLHTWFLWAPDASAFYPNTNAYGLRLGAGAQLALGSHALLGVSPFAFTTVASETVGVITAYEPRLWVALAF